MLIKNDLFSVKRSTDSQVVVFKAYSEGNGLHVYSVIRDVVTGVERDVPVLADKLLFGMDIKTERPFVFTINALPNRPIRLHVKKRSEDAIIAKTTICEKEARITSVFVEFESGKLGISGLSSITLYGIHKREEIEEKIDVSQFSGLASMLSMFS
jgi:hypothetical protein